METQHNEQVIAAAVSIKGDFVMLSKIPNGWRVTYNLPETTSTYETDVESEAHDIFKEWLDSE